MEHAEQTSSPSSWQRHYPPAMRAQEQACQQQRRRRAGIDGQAPAVGFALSGGGIRSATFCLGVFQALARRGLIRRIDCLSTVSGGGYFGSFLGRLMSREYGHPDAVEALLDPSRGTLAISPETTVNPVSWLRRNGRYMAPNGGGDLLTAAAVAARNAVALHLVIASTLLFALLLLQLPRLALDHSEALRSLHGWLPAFGPWLQQRLPLLTPSPWLDLLPPMLFLLVVPPGWAYWLIERRQPGSFHPFWGLLLVIVVSLTGFGVALAVPAWIGAQAGTVAAITSTLLLLALLTLYAEWRSHRRDDGGLTDRPVLHGAATPLNAGAMFRLADARRAVTGQLVRALSGVSLVAAIAVLDTLATSLHASGREQAGIPWGWIGAVLAALAPLATRFGRLRSLLNASGSLGPALRLPLNAMITAVAATAWLSLLVALAWLATAISHGFGSDSARSLTPTLIGLLGFGIAALMFGHTWTFLNRSSQAALYAARLTRAYLGASNPARFRTDRQSSVTEPLADDDSSIPAYTEGMLANGGPLHLINVTINETASDQGRTVLRDRKGIGLAVGPFGLSAGARHHAVYDQNAAAETATQWIARLKPVPDARDGYSMFASPADPQAPIAPERLPLGQWIGISGAAFSTGLGSNTTLGMSLLFAFANIRLGHWWDSGRTMKREITARGLFNLLLPVQAHLVNEITARFRGPERRHWYLSDGGHFENMGTYELIRRRLPMMVIVDAEADPDYRYEGFANLVRKARMDFGAAITVLDNGALDALLAPDLRPLFGNLDALRPQAGHRFSQARAALAEVRYDDDPARRSLILYLKPTMAADDPVDVREYHARNDAFPQQTTVDQFFDEAQWESYRRLGEEIGLRVFAGRGSDAADAGFTPSTLWPSFIDEGTTRRYRWQPEQ